MRIGLEASFAFMGRGGIDRYAYELANALLDREDAHRYVLFTMFAPFRRNGLDGAPIRRPRQRKLAMAQVELMRRLWSRFGRPRVETFTGPLDLFHGLHHFAAPVKGARVVTTVHDLSFEHPELEIAGAELFSRDTRRAVEQAELVIAVSEFTKGELVERYGVTAERIRVVHPGVSPRRWADGGPARPGPYFLAVGQVEPRKNLLELAQGLARARVPHELVVVGRAGRAGGGIVDELRRSGVEYRGFVAEPELRSLYRGATAFVYPSRYEGFGISVLEAMAAGVPVIASSAGSLPEVVGDAGLLVEPGEPERWAEALEHVASDDRLRAALVEAGRARAAELTWERAAAATVAVYEELGAS